MDITTVSLDTYLADPTSPEGLEEARKAAESLILTGALIVKDSRAPKEANDRFLDLFEDYFSQSTEALKKDERPEVGYQVVRCLSGHPSCQVLTSLGRDTGEHRKAKMRFRRGMSRNHQRA